MLTLTTAAADRIRDLVDQPELPDTSGMRIASDPAQGGLTLSLAAVPADEDRVLEDSAGARVFLDPQAATILDDKVLDASTDPDGRVQFSVAQQS